MLFSFYAFRRAADVNASGEVDIMDATYIQRWLANIDTPYPIGDQLSEPTQPTEPTAQSSTDEDGWGHEVFRP